MSFFKGVGVIVSVFFAAKVLKDALLEPDIIKKCISHQKNNSPQQYAWKDKRLDDSKFPKGGGGDMNDSYIETDGEDVMDCFDPNHYQPNKQK